MRGHIVAGLDIGTSTMRALVAQKHADAWEILAYQQIPSFGLRRGVVADIEEVAKNIQILMAGVQKDCQRRVDSVFVNIGGSHLYVIPSDGLISVSRADKVISREDVDRVLEATKAVDIPLNEEILQVIEHEYIIDGQRGIKKPISLSGTRLEAKVFLLCYFRQAVLNVTQAVVGAKLQIDDVVPSPVAAAEAVLTPQQREIGVALIDIGSATTSLAVYDEGELIHLAVFPLGSDSISKDIAIGLRTDIAVAEDIKKQYGSCAVSAAEKEQALPLSKSIGQKVPVKKIEMLDRDQSLSFTKKGLVDIIEPRVAEILDLMQRELKKIGRQELLPGGVVLTGGGVKLPRIKELAKDRLRLPVEIGVPRGIDGLEKDPALATVAGLVLCGGREDVHGTGLLHAPLGMIKGLGQRLRRMFRVFIP